MMPFLEGLPAACLRFCGQEQTDESTQEHASAARTKRQVSCPAKIDGMAFNLVADGITYGAGFFRQSLAG